MTTNKSNQKARKIAPVVKTILLDGIQFFSPAGASVDIEKAREAIERWESRPDIQDTAAFSDMLVEIRAAISE